MASKLYVGGLAYATTDTELEAAFAAHGTVVSAVVIKDRDTNRSKGFGFVEMSTADEAAAAIKALHDSELAGRRLLVNEARPQEERPRGGGGGGYGGGDRNGGGGSFRRSY